MGETSSLANVKKVLNALVKILNEAGQNIDAPTVLAAADAVK